MKISFGIKVYQGWKKPRFLKIPNPQGFLGVVLGIFKNFVIHAIIEHLKNKNIMTDLQAGFAKGKIIEDNLFILKIYCMENSFKEKSLIITLISLRPLIQQEKFDYDVKKVLMWSKIIDIKSKIVRQ